MIEAQLFYWTGVVLWFALQLFAVLMVLFVAIFLPIRIHNFLRKGMYDWIVIGKLKEIDLDKKQVETALRHVSFARHKNETDLGWYLRVTKELQADLEKHKMQRYD